MSCLRVLCACTFVCLRLLFCFDFALCSASVFARCVCAVCVFAFAVWNPYEFPSSPMPFDILCLWPCLRVYLIFDSCFVVIVFPCWFFFSSTSDFAFHTCHFLCYAILSCPNSALLMRLLFECVEDATYLSLQPVHEPVPAGVLLIEPLLFT